MTTNDPNIFIVALPHSCPPSLALEMLASFGEVSP
jgi:hypothetical protein